MGTRLSLAIALIGLAATACDPGTRKEETAASVETDSSLEADLKLAASDTAPFSEAADVAMAEAPAETAPIGDSIPTSSPASNRAPAGGAATGGVGMRTTDATPTPSGAPSGTRRPSRDTTPTRSAPDPGTRAPAVAEGIKNGGASAESYAGPSCASPALADQRRCLLSYLARSDVTLDRNYQALITALKRKAGTRPGQKEPDTVERLRVAQRSWLVYRDTECRRRNRGREGPLWAPTRAECLAEFSGQRASELSAALAKLNGS